MRMKFDSFFVGDCMRSRDKSSWQKSQEIASKGLAAVNVRAFHNLDRLIALPKAHIHKKFVKKSLCTTVSDHMSIKKVLACTTLLTYMDI